MSRAVLVTGGFITDVVAVSDAPGICPVCGDMWSAGERVSTGDVDAFQGWEDWRYCGACSEELFYPLKAREVIADAGCLL